MNAYVCSNQVVQSVDCVSYHFTHLSHLSLCMTVTAKSKDVVPFPFRRRHHNDCRAVVWPHLTCIFRLYSFLNTAEISVFSCLRLLLKQSARICILCNRISRLDEQYLTF